MTEVLTKMRVLLIDDQVMIGEAVHRALADAADLELHYCQNPLEGMARVKDVVPLVILLDLVMPELDGFDLLQLIRKDPETAGIPVIVLSVEEDANKKSRAFALGANDYLVKIPDKVELIARLQYHCRAFLNGQQLRRTNEQLEAATRAKSQFLAHMSHEIRTPMNGVIAMAELLMETPLNAEQRSYVDVLQRSSESLLEIINDVLDFSKIESGKMELDVADFELRRVLDDVRHMLELRATARGLELTFLVDEAVPHSLAGDAGRLRQILVNLVGNALKFTEKGHVVARVKPDTPGTAGVRLRFEVSDTGIGLTADQKAGLFQAFKQADASTTKKYGGTGLGLAISKHFVELMKGEIGVESEFGKGSTFWFTAEFDRSASQDAAKVSRDDLRGVRALVVQDAEDAGSGLLLAEMLSWGMDCDFRNTATAVAEIGAASRAGRPFELLLLDMEVTDAIGLAQKVSGAVSALPKIVLLTLGGSAGFGKECRDAGIAAMLSKPVQQDTLYACLTKVLGSASAPARTAQEHKVCRSPRILVADDNEVNQISAVRMLRKLGIDADVATDGLHAVEACRTPLYDLVLMDCSMPRLDGFSATAQIRSEEKESNRRHVPIIAVTANAVRGERENCIAAGMDDYMSKPIRFSQLRDMIARWTDPNAFESETLQQLAGNTDTGIDFNTLDKIREVDPELLGELCSAFMNKGEQDLMELKRACDAGDAASVARLAHRLRGSSLTLGMNALAEIFSELETAAGFEDFNRCGALLPRAEVEFQRAGEALRLQPEIRLRG